MQKLKDYSEADTRIRCIAVDDEPIALKIVSSYIDKIPWLKLEATFNSARKALDHLRQYKPQLLFLDINMPDLSGLEMAAMIESPINIIFTTAYSEHALEGFELGAVDYLLKPITFERFLKACERAKNSTVDDKQSIAKTSDAFFFKDGYHWIRINPDNVSIVEASDNYVLFHGQEKPVMVRMTLSDAMHRLAEKGFIRIHKSFGVSLARIEKVGSNYVEIDGKQIPLSSSYKAALIAVLQKD